GRPAHVGEVEVPVDVEHHPVGVEQGAPVVGEPPEPGEVVAGVQVLAVLAGEPLAGVDLLLQFAPPRRVQVAHGLQRTDIGPPAIAGSWYVLTVPSAVSRRSSGIDTAAGLR